jgi:parallel beta-helix repeat protein
MNPKLVLSLILFLCLSGTVFAWTHIGGGVCECNGCDDCENALNSGTCSNEVRLTADIVNYASDCIYDPPGIDNKVFDCQGHTIDGSDIANDFGIYVNSETGVQIRNCTVTDFDFGIQFRETTDCSLTDSRTISDGRVGISVHDSFDTVLLNNIANNNTDGGSLGSGLYLYGNTNLTAINNTANYNNNPGIAVYYDTGSLFVNNTANYNALETGILGNYLSNTVFENNTANNNYLAVRIIYSENVSVIGTTAINSTNNAIWLLDVPNSLLKDNFVNANSSSNVRAYILTDSPGLTIVNNTAGNKWYGFYLDNCSNSNLTGNTAYGNVYGLYLLDSANVTFAGDAYYDNSNDFYVRRTAALPVDCSFNATNLLFLNPTGTLENYTNLSIHDQLESGNSAYAVSWHSYSIPGGALSFGENYVQIYRLSGNISVKNVVWHWNQADVVPPYDENEFELWKRNDSNYWFLLNDTPDTISNTLSVSDLAITMPSYMADTFAILQPDCECDSCSGCANALNYPFCSVVYLNTSISQSGDCIYTSSGADNKTFDCQGYSITGDDTSASYGIYLYGRNGMEVRNCIVNDFYHCFYLSSSAYNNVLRNNTANSCYTGMRVYTNSDNNLLVGNTVSNNNYGVYAYSSIDNTQLLNNTAYGNSLYAMYLTGAPNTTLLDNNISNNDFYGLYLSGGAGSLVANNTADNNTLVAMAITDSPEITLSNNLIGGGLIFSLSPNSTLEDNIAYGSSSSSGMRIVASNNSILVNNTVHSNGQYGISISTSPGISLDTTIIYNNSPSQGEFCVGESMGVFDYASTNTLFLNPSGTFENYTNLSISDSVENDTRYMMMWTSNPNVLPPGTSSFREKHLLMRNASGTISIDSVTWHWAEGELPSYNESGFQIWQYLGGWNLLNDTPDTASNSLSLSNLDPLLFAQYSILEAEPTTNCPMMNSSGTYIQDRNYTGSPNAVTGGTACILIDASDVLFDCNGYSITNNGTAGTTSGVYTRGHSNVTLQNCLGITGYTNGVYFSAVNDSIISNVSVSNSSAYGIRLADSPGSSRNNLITGNSVSDNGVLAGIFMGSVDSNITGNTVTDGSTGYGIWISAGSPNVIVSGNYVANYAGSTRGIYLSGADGTAVLNNTLFNNSYLAILLSGSDNNLVAGNNISSSLSSSYYYQAGISLSGGSTSNNVSGNTVTTTNIGIFTDEVAGNLISGNEISNNRDGIWLESTNHTNVSDNDVRDNTIGIRTRYSGNNTISGNDAYYNSEMGISIGNSEYETVISNNAYNNGDRGIHISYAEHNTIASNNASGNNNNGIYLATNARYNDIVGNTANSNGANGVAVLGTDLNSLTGNTANNNGGSGISISNANNITADSNTLSGNPDSGIYIASSDNLTVTSNNASGNEYGIYAYSSEFSTMAMNDVSGNLDGIHLYFSRNCTVEENNASGNSRYGIHLLNSYENEARGNSIFGNVQHGLYLGNSDNNTLSDNNAYSNGRAGVMLEGGSNLNNLTGNDAYNNGWYGFGFYGSSDYNHVEGNTAYGNNDYGFNAYSSANLEFIGNDAYNNTDEGFRVLYSNNNLLANNTAYSNQRQGFFIIGASNNSISDNSVYNNAMDGLIAAGDGNNITGNTLYSNGGTGIATDGSDLVVSANEVYENTAHGMFLTSPNTYVVMNMAYNNSMDGIYIRGANILIENNTVTGNNNGLYLEYLITSNISDNNVYENNNGIHLFDSALNNLSGNTISGNTNYGLYLAVTDDNIAENDHIYGNAVDFVVSGNTDGDTVYLVNEIFDNPAGNYQNYTNLSLSDIISNNSEYSITWTDNSTVLPLPASSVSFHQKFVNITDLGSNSDIDNLTWHWTPSEAANFTEANLALYSNNGTWSDRGAVLDVGANTLTLSNASAFSIFAILEVSPAAPPDDDDDGPGAEHFDVDVESSCEENAVTVMDGSDPVSNAKITVTDVDAGPVASGTTDSDGEFTFSGCDITVSVYANKNGYIPETVQETLVSCASCVVEPEENETEPLPEPEPEPDCVVDEDCSAAQYCTSDGTCESVTGCGEAVDHVLVPYECGEGADCPSCPTGYSCIDNECKENEVICEDGFVGDDKNVTVKTGGEACSNCDILITAPDGRKYTGKTDENGQFVLPLSIEGEYTVALVDDEGEVDTDAIVNSLPKPAPHEEDKPPVEGTEDGDFSLLFLLILIALLIAGVVYWRNKAAKN